MNEETAVTELPDDIAAPQAEHEPDVLVEEVLVEEVSIDGMCGVY